jgi:hypothetical protein
MAVRMVLVGWLAGNAHADQRDDVRSGVGERVEAVRQDADGARGEAERDLGGRDDQIENEDSPQDL